MNKNLIALLILAGVIFNFATILAQENVTVPDVTGLSVPEAAAILNRSGLQLGVENNEGWMPDSGLPQNSISAQSIAAGETATFGTAVDVTVQRSPNAFLLYDDNDLTLVNQTGAALDLNTIAFVSADGAGRFEAARWAGSLDNGDCGQVWSIGVTSPKKHAECASTLWRTTNNPAEHFWTGASGAARFSVLQNGIERGVCDVANPGRCEFYLTGGGALADVTEYVYFAYTVDRLIVLNSSTNQWMPTGQLKIYNQNFTNPDQPLTLGDAALFPGPIVIGDVTRLAPGQCLLFTRGLVGQAAQPPQPCTVTARLDIAPEVIFWSKDFDLDSLTDGQRRTCPAAEAGKLMICIMPR